MRIATWNVNSLRSRIDRVEAFVQRHEIDVLALQETKAREDQLPLMGLHALGYDIAVAGLNQWNGVALLSRVGLEDVDELWDLAHFVGVTRPGHELSDKGLPTDRITLMEVPAMAISSTDCRARVEGGQPVWYLVPDGVVQYINKYRLYAQSSVGDS